MLYNTFIVTNKDLEKLDSKDLTTLESMIKNDFSLFDEIAEFSLDKLIEYKVHSFIDSKHNKQGDMLVSKKQDVCLKFDKHDLSIKYQYA